MLSCFGKLLRARELFGQVMSSAARFREGDHYEIVRFDNSHAATDPLVRVQWGYRVLNPTPEDWAYLTGDAVNNMRSALDHALAEVARSMHGLSDEQVQKFRLQFPICDTSKAFDNAAKQLRKCLPQDLIDKLEELQPYHGDPDDHVHDLAMLRDLSNLDKHRQLSIVTHAVFGAKVTIEPTVDVVSLNEHTGVLTDGGVAGHRQVPARGRSAGADAPKQCLKKVSRSKSDTLRGMADAPQSCTTLGYARVSTTQQDLERQLDALAKEGIPDRCIWADKKTGATTDRPGLRAMLDYARPGDTIVVTTLDRIGGNLRDVLNLVHELTERGIGLRTLADPMPIDTSNGDNAMARMAMLMLALFAEMERVYANERAAHAREVRRANGARVGRPRAHSDKDIDYARALRRNGATIAEIVEKTSIPRASLYRYLGDAG